jgi:hypothetical protein
MAPALLRLFPLALLAVLAASGAAARPPDPARPDLAVAPLASPVVVDGWLEEAAWAEAARASDFREVAPSFGAAPAVRTEALVTYSATHLYVAFRAFDDPGALRASLRDRDDIAQEDFVGVALDPRGEADRAYMVYANPLGVQQDALYADGEEDATFDLVYESAGRVTEAGYVVEMAIPFAALRVPADGRAWALTFLRGHPRDSRRVYSWAAVDFADPCWTCQFGTARGIEGIEAGTSLEVLPALVGSQSAAAVEGGGLDARAFGVQPSLSLRYGVSSNLSVSATLNPDFSQIESDAAQIDVNSSFALSLPERRPFFQEDAEVFATPMSVVYTRSINDPVAATKATGRVGRTEVAFLNAVDERTPVLLPFADRSATIEAGRSASTVLRARRGLGEASSLGATLADRRLFGGGGGTLASADARVQLGGAFALSGQVALSHTREADDAVRSERLGDRTFAGGRYTAALDGEAFTGLGATLTLNRSSRDWVLDATYEGYSPTFRAATGFVRQNDYHLLKGYYGYQFRPGSRLVERVFPLLAAYRTLDWGGRGWRTVVQPQLQLDLIGQTNVGLAYAHRHETFRGVPFEGIGYGVLQASTQFSDVVSGSGYVHAGVDVARSLEVPVAGDYRAAGLDLTLKPTARLQLQAAAHYAAMRDRASGATLFEGAVLRGQARMQFTRELAVRLVGQYDGFSERVSVEPLVSYKLNPFSVVYLGSTHGYAHDAGLGGGAGPLAPTQRQLFFKVQYLFQR